MITNNEDHRTIEDHNFVPMGEAGYFLLFIRWVIGVVLVGMIVLIGWNVRSKVPSVTFVLAMVRVTLIGVIVQICFVPLAGIPTAALAAIHVDVWKDVKSGHKDAVLMLWALRESG